MRKPVNQGYERLRLEAERKRLSELEAQSTALAEQLEAQSGAAERDREALQAENAALKSALEKQAQSGDTKTAELEARCEALAAELAERLEAERQHKINLAELNKSLEAQVAAERATAEALEARCEALSAELESTSEAGSARLEDLRAVLAADAEGARTKAAALEDEIAGLAERIGNVDESFSEPERLRMVIAPALSGAFRDVELGGHDQLTSAIAPYVVSTIRTEILNSEDELVEAIHPRLGVLIASAISNAVEELNRKVDEALPIDRWMAAAKGRLTGGPPAGWILEDGRTFIVREAMLIDRHSGVLLASEHSDLDTEVSPDEDLMAGMIAALQGFASEAYGATGAGDLRRFSFTEDTVYLRGTPTKLLAVRCSGVAPPEIERRVDELLITALERLRGDDEAPEAILTLDAFNTPVDAKDDSVSASQIMGWGLGTIAAAIALIWGNAAVTNAHDTRWLSNVEQAVAGDGSLSPYPLDVAQPDGDDGVMITGLLPDAAARTALEERLRRVGSPLAVTLDVALVSDTVR